MVKYLSSSIGIVSALCYSMIYHRVNNIGVVDLLKRHSSYNLRLWFSHYGLVGVYTTKRGMEIAVTEDFNIQTRQYSVRIYRAS